MACFAFVLVKTLGYKFIEMANCACVFGVCPAMRIARCLCTELFQIAHRHLRVRFDDIDERFVKRELGGTPPPTGRQSQDDSFLGWASGLRARELINGDDDIIGEARSRAFASRL